MKKHVIIIVLLAVFSMVTGCTGGKEASSVPNTENTSSEVSTEAQVKESTYGETTFEPAAETTTEPAAEATSEPATEPVSEESKAPDLSGLSEGEKNAVESAQGHILEYAFSRAGLLYQLTSETGDGYTDEEGAFVVAFLEENGLVDWYEEAIESAKSYLDFAAYSKSGLTDVLTNEYVDQFTEDEAEKAIAYLEENEMVDWYEEAAEAAKTYLAFTSFSKEELLEQLTGEDGDGFTKEEAEYAVSQAGY